MAESIYGKDGKLTRDGMLSIIRSGGSFTHKGNVVSSEAAIPSAADLAVASGDQSEVDRVRADKQAEIDRLQAELATLKQPAKADSTEEDDAAKHPKGHKK